jgi:DNA-directed RNA polymerase subunit L
MKYGVKFCGGCNPRYQRKEALEEIEKALKEIVEFEKVF